MLQKKYKSILTSINNPLEGIYILEFESLNGKYKYHPGQFLHIAIDEDYDGTGQWPESRCFSMQSNPNEEILRITYTINGKFTRKMEKQLSVGSEVWLKMPYGDLFQQPHNKTNTVFISGGTGITPFLSLFTHESFKEYINPKIYLGFRTKDHNIYCNELELMEQIREISLNMYKTGEYYSPKFVKLYYENIDGVIDIEEIFVQNYISSNYFISGPIAMIKAFKQTLISKGVPAQNVLTDNWE